MRLASQRVIAAVFALSVSFSVLAQQATPKPEEHETLTSRIRHFFHWESHPHWRHENLVRVLKKVRPELKLTPAQEKAFNTLITEVEKRHEQLEREFEASYEKNKIADLTTVQYITLDTQWFQEHLKASNATLEDIKQFYALLQPEQQQRLNHAFSEDYTHNFHKHMDCKESDKD